MSTNAANVDSVREIARSDRRESVHHIASEVGIPVGCGHRDQWGDLGVNGWIILGWISRRWDVGISTGLGWPRLGRWRTLVSAVMNLRVP